MLSQLSTAALSFDTWFWEIYHLCVAILYNPEILIPAKLHVVQLHQNDLYNSKHPDIINL